MPFRFDDNKAHRKKNFDPAKFREIERPSNTDALRKAGVPIFTDPSGSAGRHSERLIDQEGARRDRERAGEPIDLPSAATLLDPPAIEGQMRQLEASESAVGRSMQARAVGTARGRASAIAGGADKPVYTAEDALRGMEAGVRTPPSSIAAEVDRVLAARGITGETGKAAPAPVEDKPDIAARAVLPDGTLIERRRTDRRAPVAPTDEAFNRRAFQQLEGALKPDKEERSRLNKDYRPRIKAAKTHAEKKRLLHELRERLEGRTTEGMEARETTAAYSVWESTGVARSPEMEKINKEFNAKLNTQIAKIQREMSTATGAEFQTLQEEFDDLTGKLETAVTSQAKVFEEREAAAATKDEEALSIAKERLAEYKRTNKVDEAAREQKRVDDLEAKIDKRREDLDKRIDEEAEAEREREAKVKVAEGKAAVVEDKAAVAAEKKLRDDAATRLTEGVTEFEAQVETDQQIIKDAKVDLRDLAGIGKHQEPVEGVMQPTEIWTATKKVIADARDRIRAMPARIAARKRRIAEIKTRAPIANGRFGGKPPPQFEIESLHAAIIANEATGRKALTATQEDVYWRLSEKQVRELEAVREKARRANQ